jgi:3-oxoacyl-[acyl-carrier-protein] synthase II
MSRREVWITGIGLVTPAGIGWRETWESMCAGRSAIARARSFDPTGLKSQMVGEVPEAFDRAFATTCRLPFPKRYARFTQLALLAAHLSLEDAGIAFAEDEDLSRVGVAMGVGAGSFHYLLPLYDAWKKPTETPESVIDHNFVVKYMANAAAGQVSLWKHITGPSTTISSACASGAQAIAAGLEWVRAGRVDVCLAGGADSTLSRFSQNAYSQIQALSTANDRPERASRPFDKSRDGFVMAEGSAVLVLEEAERARRRGAARYAVVRGQASTSEAYNVVAPRPDGAGAASTIRLALADAAVNVDSIDYVSAHGTSTPMGDAAETAGIKAALGEHARKTPVSAQKSMIGHAIGASSAIQTAVAALTVRHGVLTPTINYETPDPACDLDYVPNQAREQRVRTALLDAFGFGGHNCCLVLGE